MLHFIWARPKYTCRFFKNWTKNFISKCLVYDLHLKVTEGVGMMQCKILDQYLTSDKVSTSSIECIREYRLLKNFNQKL